MTGLDRREFLALGALGTAAAIGGCLQESSDRGAYSDWIPASRNGQLVAAIDFSIASESETAQELFPMIVPSSDDERPTYAPAFRNVDDLDDPLLTVPLRMGGSQIGLYLLSLSVAGLGQVVERAGQSDGIQTVVVADGTLVATGDFDVSEAADKLRSGTSGMADVAHEKRGERGDFAIYETTAPETDSALGLSETAIVLADDRDSVVGTIEAERGERPRATERNDAFDWLVDAAGDGHVVFGWERPVSLDRSSFGTAHERAPDVLDPERHSALTSIHFGPDDDRFTARFAMVADGELAASTRERLTDELGTSSDDVSTTVGNGDRLSVTGTYANDAIDLQYLEPGEENGSDGQRDLDRDPPPAVTNAVPDDAFSFTHNPDQGTVRVGFEKTVDVDEITILAIGSGNESSSSTPDVIDYLNVFVESDDTEIVVIATVDGHSGVVASESLSE